MLFRSGVFKFSPEEGTRAATMDDQVEPGVAQERYSKAMEAQQIASSEEHDKRLGQEARIIIETVAPRGYSGRTEFQAPDVDGITRLTWEGRELIPGDMVICKIVSHSNHDFSAFGNSPR